MKWNEYARVGARLQKACKAIRYTSKEYLIDASFILDILDEIELEKGCVLKIAMPRREGVGTQGHLVALKEWEYKTKNIEKEEWKYYPLDHIIVKETAMSAFQALLLDFVPSWIPAYAYGIEMQNTFIFSGHNLRSINMRRNVTEGAFNHKDFSEDERIIPVVKFKNDVIDLTCCYWNDLEGLIRESFSGTIYDNRLFLYDAYTTYDESTNQYLTEELKHKEVLFKYRRPFSFYKL